MSKVLELIKDIENGMNGGRYNLGPETALTLTKIIRLQHEALNLVASSKDLQLTESKDYLFMTLQETNYIAGGEIKPKEPCKHERFQLVRPTHTREYSNEFQCLDCNKTLKPNWSIE